MEGGELFPGQQALQVGAERDGGVFVDDFPRGAVGLEDPGQAVLHAAQFGPVRRDRRKDGAGGERGQVAGEGRLDPVKGDRHAFLAQRAKPLLNHLPPGRFALVGPRAPGIDDTGRRVIEAEERRDVFLPHGTDIVVADGEEAGIGDAHGWSQNDCSPGGLQRLGAAGPGLAEGFVGQGVQLAAGRIAGDAAIKQPGTQFGDFLVVEPVDGLLDFLHGAHAGNMAGKGSQARGLLARNSLNHKGTKTRRKDWLVTKNTIITKTDYARIHRCFAAGV